MTRCQICGRRKGTTGRGLVVFHHVAGRRCEGVGYPPIEASDDRLVAEVKRLRNVARVKRLFIRDLLARRVNWIDPAHETLARLAEERADRLERRLKRHRAWPDRFARQMERHGYGDPPPAYLTRHA